MQNQHCDEERDWVARLQTAPVSRGWDDSRRGTKYSLRLDDHHLSLKLAFTATGEVSTGNRIDVRPSMQGSKRTINLVKHGTKLNCSKV